MSKPFIIKKKELKTSDWGGGKTTELFIHPNKSLLKESNFDFRLSTATIEVEKSEFTSLPGVHRKLLLLEGKLELTHQNHHTRNIPLFDVDEFEGDWKTTSKGKAVDFNLMSKKEISSKISVFRFTKGAEYSERNLSSFTFLYLYKGEIETSFGNMEQGDILVMNTKELFDLRTKEISTLVHVTLFD